MEKQPSYLLMLSLKEMALRRIAVVLVNQPDFLAMTEKFPYEAGEWYQSQWLGLDSVDSKIREETSKLELPESLSRQMIPILNAVGSEILKWKTLHTEFLRDSTGDIGVPVLKKLCWTSAGTVNYQKTAEALVCSNVVDIVQRFELTCLYCLEDYCPVIWKELPERSKRVICNGEVTSPHLQLFFPYILKKQSRCYFRGTIVPRDFFKYSALYGNKTAAEYCFGKLSREERKASLFQTAVDVIRDRNRPLLSEFTPTQEKLSDVLSYLLSMMTPEEQMRIFKELPCEVLRCFLDWPWQDLFLDIADVIWPFLPESKYRSLALEVGMHIDNSGYYIPSFLQEFFLHSPRSFRKSFVDEECSSGYFFRQFFDAQEYETIKVILRNIDASDRVRLIFSNHVLKLLNEELLFDRWHMVEVCIREAALSKEDREGLRGAFRQFVTKSDQRVLFKWRTQKRKRFFEFLDEMDANPADQKSPEDEPLPKVKKSCHGEENDALPRN